MYVSFFGEGHRTKTDELNFSCRTYIYNKGLRSKICSMKQYEIFLMHTNRRAFGENPLEHFRPLYRSKWITRKMGKMSEARII